MNILWWFLKNIKCNVLNKHNFVTYDGPYKRVCKKCGLKQYFAYYKYGKTRWKWVDNGYMSIYKKRKEDA